MELNKKEVLMVLDLIRLAWASGAVKSEEIGRDITALRTKLSTPQMELVTEDRAE